MFISSSVSRLGREIEIDCMNMLGEEVKVAGIWFTKVQSYAETSNNMVGVHRR